MLIRRSFLNVFSDALVKSSKFFLEGFSNFILPLYSAFRISASSLFFIFLQFLVIPFGNFSSRKGGFQKKDIALFFKRNRLDIIVDQHKKHKLIRILSTGPMPGHGTEVAVPK